MTAAIKQRAIELLGEIAEYTNAGLEHGASRVYLYYDDVDGDWLDEWERIDGESVIAAAVEKHDRACQKESIGPSFS